MAEQPQYPDTGKQPDRTRGETSSGTSRWPRVVGIILAVLFLLFLVMVLVGGGVGGHQIPQHAPPPDAAGPVTGAILDLR